MTTVSLDAMFTGFMAFVRISVLLLTIPIFAGRVPVQIRVAMGAMVAWLIVPFIPVQAEIPVGLGRLIVSSINEAIIGFTMGLAAQIAFATVEFAGRLIATEIGLMISSDINPFTESNAPTVSIVLYQMTVLVFLITGIHQDIFLAFLRSFDIQPAGQLMLNLKSADLLVRQTGDLLIVGFQMAAPVIAVNFILNLSFAVLGRAVAGMNVFILSFPLRILAGLGILLATAGLLTQFIVQINAEIPENMLRLATFDRF